MDRAPGAAENTPENAPGPAAKRQDLYRLGFYICLVYGIVSSVFFIRLWYLAKDLNDDYRQLKSTTEKALSLAEECHAQAMSDIANLKECGLQLKDTVDLTESCVDDFRRANLSFEKCAADTRSIYGEVAECREELVWTLNQDRLSMIKLSDNLESCYEENARLQKKLLQPCSRF